MLHNKCYFPVSVKFPRAGHIARHPPVTSRRKGYGADLRSVRYAGTLELLAEEAFEEDFQPMLQHIV